jgi:RNA polymerase sigma factor for flagellar operon FliA
MQPDASPTPQEQPLHEVWNRYFEARSALYRNELIVAYQPLVAECVRRLPADVRAYWEIDELRSFGQDGLVRAITRWADPDLSRFVVYARRCIRGAVFDELRHLDWLPRTTRNRIIAYRSTFDDLIGELGRNPEASEVCVAMGLPPRQSAELVAELHSSQLLHLSTAAREDSEQELAETICASDADPELQVMFSADVEALHKAIATLGQREQTVLGLSFGRGMTQEKIGEMIGVGGPQVCKIQAGAVRKLRAILTSRAGDRILAQAS